MKDKNKKLIIVVASLLLVVGVTFAYFTASTIFGGNGANVSGTTATLEDSVLSVEGSLEFNDTNIYPGHKNVSSIKATATGDNTLIPYNVIWEGENTLNTPLNYTVYKTTSEVDVSASCEAKNGVVDGARLYYEECTISNQESLGSIISSGTIAKGETKKTIISDEFITSSNEGTEVYYYVILEYPNLEENQNSDIGGSFIGKVLVELNDTDPDIIIAGTYIEEDGEYKEVEDIPTEGYELNTSMSTCTNNATVGWDKSNKRIYIESLSNSGTECTLYYDEYNEYAGKEYILSHYDTVLTRNDFSTTVTNTTTGTIYKSLDESQYDNDGEVYYFAGNPTDNWVQFGGYYWRIIRINGDGSIRLIYSGDSSSGPVSTGEATQIGTSSFNEQYTDNAYVGYMYGTPGSSTYEETHANINDSTIKTVLDKWYQQNLLSYESYISAEAGFCNDRRTESGVASGYGTLGYGINQTAYASWGRLYQNEWKNSQNPSLKCGQNNDLFTVNESGKGNKKLTYSIGLITSDEAIFAGSFGGNENNKYYLYTRQNYWTMSPSDYYNGASIFAIRSYGNLSYDWLYDMYGVRPVINLRSDVILTGSGTTSDPYRVVGA